MLRFVFAVLGLVSLFVCAGVTALRALDRWLADPLTIANRQQQLDEARRAAEWWAALRDATTVPLEMLIIALCAAVAVAAGLALLRLYDGRIKTRHTFTPDRRGLYAVSAAALDQAALVGLVGYHATQMEAARNPVHQLPATLRTYSPRYGNDARRTGVGSDPNTSAAIAEPPACPAPTPAPTFGELLHRRWLGPGMFALGWDPARGMPAYGTFGALYSVAVLGAAGSGKSTAARGLITQTALNDGKLIVIDPHLHAGRDSLAGDLSPLQSAFLLPPVDDDPAAINRALDAVQQLLSERKAGATGPVVLVVVDEWTSLMGRGGARAEGLARTMRLLAAEGRKLGLHGLVAMQDATKEAVGPLRDVLASSYVLRSRPQHARMVAPGLKADTWQLQPGQAWLDQVSAPPRLLLIPECAPADVAAAGRMLAPPVAAGPRNDAASRQSAPSSEPILRAYTPPAQEPMRVPVAPVLPVQRGALDVENSAPSTGSTGVDDETRRILTVYERTRSYSATAREVYGYKSTDTFRRVKETLARHGISQSAEGGK